MTQIRGTLELLMVVPALVAMLVSPSIKLASDECRSLGRDTRHDDKGTMGATGTCTTLGNAEKDLGKDIGRWLEHPKPHTKPNDRLGQ